MKRIVQVLISKAVAVARLERIIPQLLRFWQQREEAQPISRSRGACGRGLVGWFGICGLISGLFVCLLLFGGTGQGTG